MSIDDVTNTGDAAAAPEIPDTRPNPEHWYAQLEWREIVNSALAALGPAIRLMLVSYFVDERSVRQLAEMLGITVSAAKSRIGRGRRALCNKIREHLVSAGAV